MKRLMILLTVLLLPLMAHAEEREIVYRAKIYRETRIRKVQDMDSRDWLKLVPEDETVDIYEYGEEWCLCGYKGSVGYLPTERLYEFWRMGEAMLPGFEPMAGVAVLTEEVHVETEGYKGNDVPVGAKVAVRDETGLVPMMRSTAALPEGSFTFTSFVAADQAQPGDILYGFTTWYDPSEKTTLNAGRVFNIEEGVRRMDGTVILPGESFSFNALCAPYTKANGYRRAPNISKAGVGYGGGICQVTTTMFQALQGTLLELTDWSVHRYTGVKYAKINHDAAVSSVDKDFCFINRYPYPVRLTLLAQEGVLTCLFVRGEDETPEAQIGPLYTARTKKEAKAYEEADTKSGRIETVKAKAVVEIWEYGEKWCRVRLEDQDAWMQTAGLYEFNRVSTDPVPGMVYNTGLLVVTEETRLTNPKDNGGDLFRGLTVQPGMVLGAVDETGRIPFRRFVIEVPEENFTFRPFVSASAAQPGDLLYAFTTYYNDSVGGSLAKERQQNIELAAQRLSGTVVAPGETFSYNAVCGPYTRGNGYVLAPNISKEGKGVGGGVCQLSTTLYNAILGLDINPIAREVHQISGVKYVPIDFDCAVGSSKDFCFVNPYPWPLRIEALTQEGALTVLCTRGE